MKRALISVATVLFGIVPASLLIVSNAIFIVSIGSGPAEGIKVVTSWMQVALFVLTGAAAVIGYVALFFAARLRTSRLVAVALLVGVGVVIHELISSPHEPIVSLFMILPAIVALAHSIAHFVGRHPHVKGGAFHT